MARKPIRSLSDIPGVHTGPVAPANAPAGDIWFPTPDITPPVIGALTATGGAGTLNLSWPAGTDDVGVTLYEYSYGTVADFTGATVATTTSLSVALTPAAGTYYTRYRARDAAGNWSGYVTAPSVVVTAVLDPTAPVIASFAATAGNTQNVLAWSASDNVTPAGSLVIELKWGTTAGTYPNTIAIANGATGYTHTGLTNGTPIYYSLRVQDAASNWSTASTASATPSSVTVVFFNDFSAGQAIDTTKLTASTAGGGTVDTTYVPNFCTCRSTSGAAAALLKIAAAANPSAQERFTVKFRNASTDEWFVVGCWQGDVVAAPLNSWGCRAGLVRYNSGVGRFAYMDASAVLKYWDFTNGWVATPNGTFTLTPGTDYIMLLESDANGWVMELRNGDGTAITNGRTAKVLWTGTYPGTGGAAGYHIAFGDALTDNYTATMQLSSIKQESGIGTVS